VGVVDDDGGEGRAMGDSGGEKREESRESSGNGCYSCALPIGTSV
jgi:hypothetical protein